MINAFFKLCSDHIFNNIVLRLSCDQRVINKSVAHITILHYLKRINYKSFLNSIKLSQIATVNLYGNVSQFPKTWDSIYLFYHYNEAQ